MSRQILVIVIDPSDQTITVDTIEDDLGSMGEMVRGTAERSPASLGDPDEILWVDEDAKSKENHHFHIRGYAEIVSGKCFICRELNTADGFVNEDTTLDVADVQGLVAWLPHLDNLVLI